jgi:hypothetical protein
MLGTDTRRLLRPDGPNNTTAYVNNLKRKVAGNSGWGPGNKGMIFWLGSEIYSIEITHGPLLFSVTQGIFLTVLKETLA